MRWGPLGLDEKRAMALSLAFNGASVGGVLFVPLWTVLIDAVGFPTAAVLIGVTIIITTWVIARTYLRVAPIDLGVVPDGGGTSQPLREPMAKSTRPLTRRELFQHRQ